MDSLTLSTPISFTPICTVVRLLALPRAKLISTHHNPNPFYLKPGIKHAECLTATLCAAVICISDYLRDFVHHQIGLPMTKLHTVPYGYAPPTMVPPSYGLRESLGLRSEPLIGVVARLIEQKGHASLLHAMRLVAENPSGGALSDYWRREAEAFFGGPQCGVGH